MTSGEFWVQELIGGGVEIKGYQEKNTRDMMVQAIPEKSQVTGRDAKMEQNKHMSGKCPLNGDPSLVRPLSMVPARQVLCL